MMNTGEILSELIANGVIDGDKPWMIEPATGGLNSRVFRVRAGDTRPAFIVRVRDAGSFANEVEALEDVAECPGVPEVSFANDRMLVHPYLPGRPRALADLPAAWIARLATALACLHRHTYDGYTPWPERTRVRGSLRDLFRFRVDSLANYASYSRDHAGIDPRLPGLVGLLSSPDMLVDASWDDRQFSRLHGDLSRGNMLWSGDGVALIDWEFSRAGDPAEDLAYLLTEQPAGPEMIDRLRDLYPRAGGDPGTWNRVPAYGIFTAVDSALWWADYAGRHAIDAGDEIEQRITTALYWLP